MDKVERRYSADSCTRCQKSVIMALIALLLFPFNVFSMSRPVADDPEQGTAAAGGGSGVSGPAVSALPDSVPAAASMPSVYEADDVLIDVRADRKKFVPTDSVEVTVPAEADSIVADPFADEWVERKIAFAPDPIKAVWLSALFPGLGQIYNRRYWKLPIIVGGYMGLAYATSWNNGMLRDYTNAYADITDSDPTTNSYMDFFASTVKEEDLDKTWLTSLLQSRKNYFRRNRDLCIICMVGVYLLAMVDAYVDASLSHFDITPDLSMDLYPSLIQDGRNRFPSVGLQWAINF